MVGNEAIVRGPNPLTVDVWGHVALTISSGTSPLWIDGVSMASAKSAPPRDVTPSRLAPTASNDIGKPRLPDALRRAYNGDLRIYDGALSAA